MSICPIAYSSIIRFYDNWPEDSFERSAALFREAIPGCEEITADELKEWKAGHRQRLEFGIQAASEIVADVESDSETHTDKDATGMMAPPEDPIETAEFVEADLIHNLHQQNYTMRDIYGMLIPEIELLGEGAERAEERRDNGQQSSESSGPVSGNRGGSRVDSMFR